MGPSHVLSSCGSLPWSPPSCQEKPPGSCHRRSLPSCSQWQTQVGIRRLPAQGMLPPSEGRRGRSGTGLGCCGPGVSPAGAPSQRGAVVAPRTPSCCSLNHSRPHPCETLTSWPPSCFLFYFCSEFSLGQAPLPTAVAAAPASRPCRPLPAGLPALEGPAWSPWPVQGGHDQASARRAGRKQGKATAPSPLREIITR